MCQKFKKYEKMGYYLAKIIKVLSIKGGDMIKFTFQKCNKIERKEQEEYE